MSNRDPEAWSNDDRAVRPRERTETTGRPLTDIVYYGFGQLFLLCLPMMWLVSVTPFSNGVVRIGFAVSILTIPVLVGFFRRGRLTVGRAWPRFTNADLGVGGGYGDFLIRSVYFSSVIALCAYGGGAAELITGSVLADVIVAAAVAVFGTSVFPYLTGTSTPALAGERRRMRSHSGQSTSVRHPSCGDSSRRSASSSSVTSAWRCSTFGR